MLASSGEGRIKNDCESVHDYLGSKAQQEGQFLLATLDMCK